MDDFLIMGPVTAFRYRCSDMRRLTPLPRLRRRLAPKLDESVAQGVPARRATASLVKAYSQHINWTELNCSSVHVLWTRPLQRVVAGGFRLDAGVVAWRRRQRPVAMMWLRLRRRRRLLCNHARLLLLLVMMLMMLSAGRRVWLVVVERGVSPHHVRALVHVLDRHLRQSTQQLH